jgi:four helix bundle protein
MSGKTALNADPLWEKTAEVAEYAYGLLKLLPEEEAWGMASTMRRVGFAVTDDIAEAIGSYDPRDQLHHYGHARREMFGLKNSLVMAKRLEGMEIDSDKMLIIEEVLLEIDNRFHDSQQNIQQYLSEFENYSQQEKKQ